jgi:hypothetical protein
MNYDEAIRRAEELVAALERTEALDMTEYKKKAAEVKKLLDFCESQLKEQDDNQSNNPIER